MHYPEGLIQEGGRESVAALRREAAGTAHVVQCPSFPPAPGESSAHIRGNTISAKGRCSPEEGDDQWNV